jgi:uncharacterized protein involved in exopolysaccharide biosynthesis
MWNFGHGGICEQEEGWDTLTAAEAEALQDELAGLEADLAAEAGREAAHREAHEAALEARLAALPDLEFPW